MDYWLAYFSTAILYIIPCIGLLSKKQLFKANKITFFLILGLLSHTYFAYLIIFNQGINLNFSNALLIIGLITVLIYTVLNLRGNYHRLEFLTLIPVIAIILFNPIIQNDHYITQYFSLNALIHVLTALVGYSFLAFGAIFSIFLRFIENDLHEKNDGSFFSSNLSILAMENQLFTIYWIGFILLSITMLSGSYFSEELFGTAFVLNHKFLLSSLAWLLYGGLLIGRAQFGWRGKKAINLSLSAFLILVLAYIGTKFILEIVLA